ncbi:Metal cation transporter, ZIP family [Aphelenchoides besseyi]|nr:Metal cation transporter, ZIP family [Aphelenchoides besseyi]
MIPGYNPIVQALLASLFTWFVTALGSSLVFILPSNSKKFLDVSLGFAAGVMLAASFWSLLAPAIEISETTMGSWAIFPVALGFALGAAFVHLSDYLIPSCVKAEVSIIRVLAKERKRGVRLPMANTNSPKERYLVDGSQLRQRKEPSRMLNNTETIELSDAARLNIAAQRMEKPDIDEEQFALSWRRILLLCMAVTVHNIPEGLSVGVGFGSVGKTPAATFDSAFNLALGIGLQNFPEGLAVSLPLTGFGYSKFKAFLYGQMSGMVEPLAAVLGAFAVILMEPVLPYALAFAAGAMVYVVFDDIIPEAHRNGNGKLASMGAIIGFLVMMSMDVGLA